MSSSRTYGASGSRGFTLIEILVTLTLFSVAMTALVGGLRGGIKAWEGVKAHHEEAAESRAMFRRLGEDFRRLAVVSEEEPPLVETVANDGGESLTITTLASRREHLAGLGCDWSRVTYSVGEVDDGEGLVLKRLAVPHIGNRPMGRGQPVEKAEDLPGGVQSVSFDYVTPEGIVSEWENEERLPGAIVATVELETGRTVSKTVWIPIGALGS